MYSIRRWLYRPKRTDKSLLARFFFADEELNAVAAELDSFDGRKDPERCTNLVNKLRSCQDKVLLTIQAIMEEVIAYQRASRDFRVKYPDDVIQENLLGQLWFGAECLAAGSSIMHREAESASMRPLARALTRTLDNLRNQLRDHCLRSGSAVYPPKIRESLVMFDQLLAEFELSYVSAMVPVKSSRDFETMQLIVVLFSETVERAIKRGLISRENIDACDPLLMFTIPRLAIISGLILYTDGPLNPDREADSMSEMFRPFQTLLCKIKQLLFTLTPAEFTTLERALCTTDETPPTTPPSCDLTNYAAHAPLQCAVIQNPISMATSQNLVSNMIAGSSEENVIQSGSLNPVMTNLPIDDVTTDSANLASSSGHATQEQWVKGVLEDVIESIESDRDAQSPNEIFEDAREFLSPNASVSELDLSKPVDELNRTLDDQSELKADQSPSVSTDQSERRTQNLEQQSPSQSESISKPTSQSQTLLQTVNQSARASDSDSELTIADDHFKDPQTELPVPVNHVFKKKKRDLENYEELSSHSVDSSDSSDSDSICDTVSTSSSYSSSCNDDQEVLLAIKAAQMANRKGIRSRFKSSEELNHKLFVCVSGVADQLQTNFAADLRNILRTVFSMHNSDSLDQSVPSKPVTSQEGGARFQIRPGRERLQAPPRWVPDEEVTSCTACHVIFTFVRRRHHCRNCGQIFCQQCSSATMLLPQFGHRLPVRVCETCANGALPPPTTP